MSVIQRFRYNYVLCTEDDWETTHLAKVGVEDEEEGIPREDSGLHHDDAILTAVPILRSGSTANHTPKSAEEVGDKKQQFFSFFSYF